MIFYIQKVTSDILLCNLPCASIKSILSSSKNEFCKGRQHCFENTPRNFVTERFLYFYCLCSMPQYDFISCFIKGSKFRVPPSLFFTPYIAPVFFLRLNRREHAARLRSYSCNFLTDFLRTWIPHVLQDAVLRRPLPAIRAKFQVSFRKVAADAYARIYSCRRANCDRRLRVGKV